MNENEEDDYKYDFGLYDFEIDLENYDLLPQSKNETRYIKPKINKLIKEQYLKYEYAEELVENYNLEDRFYAIVAGSFIFGDLIEAIIVKNKMKVEEMVVSTLSYNENNIDSFYGLMANGYLEKLDLIISVYFYNHEKQNLIKYALDTLDFDNRFNLSVCGTHCKTCIFKSDNNYIVIQGSANLRSSNSLEQVIIENNKELYDFNYEYSMNIIKAYSLINKSVEGKTLWQTILGRKAKAEKNKGNHKQI